MSTLTGTIIIALILCGLAILGLLLNKKPLAPGLDHGVFALAAIVCFGVVVIVGFASGVLP